MRNVARICLCVFHFLSMLFFALACNSRLLFYHAWNLREDLYLFGLGLVILCIHYCFLFLGAKKAFWNNAVLTALAAIDCVVFGLLLLLTCFCFVLRLIGLFRFSLGQFLPVVIACQEIFGGNLGCTSGAYRN